MVFSFDGHVGAPPDRYLEYIEPRYRGDLEALQAENDEWAGSTKFHGFERGERYGVFDAGRLLEELDAEGIAGQVLLNGHGMATTPFFSVANDPYPPAQRVAGAKAFHRWLADFAADGDGRLVPIADPGPCLDMAAAVAELRWVREAGFSGVYLPGAVYDPALPPHHDPYFDRFWAACEELGLVLVLHAAFGAEQGRVLDMLRRKSRMKEALVERNPEFASLDLSSLTAGELLELGGGVPEDSMQRFGPSALHAARRGALADDSGWRLRALPQAEGGPGRAARRLAPGHARAPRRARRRELARLATEAERVLRPERVGRPEFAAARGSGDAPRDRDRQVHLRHRLSASRRHLARHLRMATRWRSAVSRRTSCDSSSARTRSRASASSPRRCTTLPGASAPDPPTSSTRPSRWTRD